MHSYFFVTLSLRVLVQAVVDQESTNLQNNALQFTFLEAGVEALIDVTEESVEDVVVADLESVEV